MLWIKLGFVHLERILLTPLISTPYLFIAVRLFYVVVNLYFFMNLLLCECDGGPWLWWRVLSDHSLSLSLCLSTLKFVHSVFCFFLPFLAFSSLLCWMLFLYNYVSISVLPAKNGPLIACFHPVIRRGIFTTPQDAKLLCLGDLLHVIWDRIR